MKHIYLMSSTKQNWYPIKSESIKMKRFHQPKSLCYLKCNKYLWILKLGKSFYKKLYTIINVINLLQHLLAPFLDLNGYNPLHVCMVRRTAINQYNLELKNTILEQKGKFQVKTPIFQGKPNNFRYSRTCMNHEIALKIHDTTLFGNFGNFLRMHCLNTFYYRLYLGA